MSKPNLAIAYNMKRKKMAQGGKVEPETSSIGSGDDIVDRIMTKRMSEGGIIANAGEREEDLADSDPAEFDDLALDDHLKSENSGAADGDFLGNEQEDEDRKDIVSRVMKQRSMKQRNPRPA